MRRNQVELWGGVECTVNRVRGRYFEQIGRQGHLDRSSDFHRFAALGIRALRQPVLWEQIAPGALSEADWRFADLCLARLRNFGIRPIIGLVHHGSGPAHTDLLDPEFAPKLAEYARAVAQRYHWVEDYTPINEPLTTARFSCLYGHWHPNHSDPHSFVAALLNQCKAIAMAMQAIREINPNARLIQTDDLGYCFSTPHLRYQAEFENERRWLAWDLVLGRVGPTHPMWNYLAESGASERDLHWLLENPCPPDIIGINHYLSSERFLDENVSRYRHERVHGNSFENYVDVLAARVRAAGAAGPRRLLKQAWDRYGIQIAITEVHNGCTREEQLRWFVEVWNAAERARTDGVDLVAVTAWALLGGFDWDTLLTEKNDRYEPGVFDIRAPEPRPTAIANAIRELANGREVQHPVLDTPGWWDRPQRLLYGHSITDAGEVVGRHTPQLVFAKSKRDPRPILITGGRGTLGRAIERECVIRGLEHKLLVRSDMDIADAASVRACLHAIRPWAVINAAGYVRVDDAETDVERCYRENTEGPALLVDECSRHGVKFITYSSDLVFDGTKAAPYVESDAVSPLNIYGRSKAIAEHQVLVADPTALVVRTSAFFSPRDNHNFITSALRVIGAGEVFRAASDQVVSPTYVPDLVNATLDLLVDGEFGVVHLANVGQISWADLAREAATRAKLDASLVEGVESVDLDLPAERPLFSAMRSERVWVMPTLDSALHRYFLEAAIERDIALTGAA